MNELTSSTTLYSQQFYDARTVAVQDCVKFLVPLINNLVAPTSVVDFGCARGEWLRSFAEQGVQEIQGIDGPYVDQNHLHIPRERFIPANLADMEPLGRTFDLALCLEVVEHLPREASRHLIGLLTQAAPVVLFSAAIPGQTGVGHINCRWPNYWFKLCEDAGYAATDPIRRSIWQCPQVPMWYQQNMFVFVRESHLETYPHLSNHRFRQDYPTLVDPKLLWKNPPGVRLAARELATACLRSLTSLLERARARLCR